MDPTMLPDFVIGFFTFMSVLFVFVIGLTTLALLVLYVVDRCQTKIAVRRNYPVIGRLRPMFEHLGTFFRQYFFAMDREEMPFNRELRNWAYRAAKDIDNTVPFGSTRDLNPVGTVLFANAAFPMLDEDAAPAGPLPIGPQCRHPYQAPSFFNVSAMSYGAISRPAVRALSRGAAAAGCWLNTGEGGLSPWHLEGECDLVFQIGTAMYGVRDAAGGLDETRLAEVAAHAQVRMFEIKLSQGAKPGKGGILPGVKVSAEIAAIRGIPEGQDSISPNRFRDVADVGGLLDFIARIGRVTGKPVGIKTVIGDPRWLDALFAEIDRRGADSAPDFITVDGADGGTGAAPLPLIDYVGMPIRESLPLVVDRLVRHGLRDRIRVIASGKLITPGPVAWAFCSGADFVSSARGFMFALGCIQAMQCNKNTCPTGVTTNDPRLQRGLDPEDKAGRVAAYARNLRHEVEIIAHSCGLADPRRLRRHHCRIVQASGRSVAMDEIWPEAKPAKSPKAKPAKGPKAKPAKGPKAKPAKGKARARRASAQPP